MAVTTHSTLPGTIVAGDSLAITETLTDTYPASSWTLHYVLKEGNNIIRLDSTASSDDHVFAETPATTGSWRPGGYISQKYVDNSSGERVTLGHGAVTIEPNIAQADPDVTQWQEIYDFAMSAVKRLAKERVVSYSSGGFSATLTSVDEALRLANAAKKELKDLERGARMAAGLGDRRNIRFRM